MKNGIEKVLKKICSLSKGNIVYLLKANKSGVDVLNIFGTFDVEDKKFSALNKLISRKKEPTDSELKKSPAFAAFSRATGFKFIFKYKLPELENTHFHLIILSKSKLESTKIIEHNIAEPLIQLTKEIAKNNKLFSEKGSGKKKEANNLPSHILKEIADSIRPVLYSINADASEYLYISEAVRTLFGYSPEDIYKNKFLINRSIDKESMNDYNSFIEKLRQGEDAYIEYKILDRFGKENWVRHTGTPVFKNGRITNFVGIIEEISDEKITEIKLERSEEKFRLLIDTADDLIFILNGFGYFGMVNKNGANTLGYTPEEMIGRHFLEFIDKNDESVITEAFNKILKSDKVTTFETVFLDRFDKGVTFEIHAKPLITDGEVSGMISIGRNITDRKLDEQKIRDLNIKLVEANRIISIERERARHKIGVLEEVNKLKSEFISNISHELRTPLASVVGFAETIESDPDLPKEMVKEFSGIILSEGKRLAKLINDVLDFSKLESGEEEIKFEPVNIVELVEQVYNSFANQLNEKTLTLTKEFSADKIIITADRNRINQVFTNLISNSIKFTNDGGRISIIVNDFQNEIEIAVSDTGIGIPEKDLPKLFQKFSKVQRVGAPISGTGFGLATVKQIIDIHKGFIRVTSRENNGTTFIIRLPKQQHSRG
jgi:PAS domain S-box-containing protein